MDKYDCLKLENQLCFPLYVASKEVIRKYKPILGELDLTYTQYIAMMVIWEEKKIKVTELAKKLYLDTGTISPLIRKLKSKDYIRIHRDEEDERVQIIEITKIGLDLREQAINVPKAMMENKCINLSLEEIKELKKLLDKVNGVSYE
ncbi:MAG: MarR family transcriptional regulator [Bacilli bacterium]|nr:MarR family transcriptional regulator [Bacilli bacterium]